MLRRKLHRWSRELQQDAVCNLVSAACLPRGEGERESATAPDAESAVLHRQPAPGSGRSHGQTAPTRRSRSSTCLITWGGVGMGADAPPRSSGRSRRRRPGRWIAVHETARAPARASALFAPPIEVLLHRVPVPEPLAPVLPRGAVPTATRLPPRPPADPPMPRRLHLLGLRPDRGPGLVRDHITRHSQGDTRETPKRLWQRGLVPAVLLPCGLPPGFDAHFTSSQVSGHYLQGARLRLSRWRPQ